MKTRKNRTDKSPKINHDDTCDPIAKGFYPRIEPGNYEAVCFKTEVALSPFGPRDDKVMKIYIWFRIKGGAYDGTKLLMACNFYTAKEMSFHCKYFEQWSIANGGPPNAGQRMARKIFIGKRFMVKVVDTKRKDDDQLLKSDSLQYSVVEKIIERMD